MRDVALRNIYTVSSYRCARDRTLNLKWDVIEKIFNINRVAYV